MSAENKKAPVAAKIEDLSAMTTSQIASFWMDAEDDADVAKYGAELAKRAAAGDAKAAKLVPSVDKTVKTAQKHVTANLNKAVADKFQRDANAAFEGLHLVLPEGVKSYTVTIARGDAGQTMSGEAKPVGVNAGGGVGSRTTEDTRQVWVKGPDGGAPIPFKSAAAACKALGIEVGKDSAARRLRAALGTGRFAGHRYVNADGSPRISKVTGKGDAAAVAATTTAEPTK